MHASKVGWNQINLNSREWHGKWLKSVAMRLCPFLGGRQYLINSHIFSPRVHVSTISNQIWIYKLTSPLLLKYNWMQTYKWDWLGSCDSLLTLRSCIIIWCSEKFVNERVSCLNHFLQSIKSKTRSIAPSLVL